MDRGVDDDAGDDCVVDDDELQSITPRFEVVTSYERRDLTYGVRFLGYACAVIVEGKGGVLIDVSSSVSLSVLSLVSSLAGTY